MKEQETLATKQIAEKAEQTAEETPKTYTEAEFNAKLDEVLGKKLARKEAKLRREYSRMSGGDTPSPQSEAEEIIRGGGEAVTEALARLAAKGAQHMTDGEKTLFLLLADHRRQVLRQEELARLGVDEAVAAGEDFRAFAARFRHDVPAGEIYGLYSLARAAKDITPMGSMKNHAGSGVKDFYTAQEARRFSRADYDRDPALYAAVQRSMLKW